MKVVNNNIRHSASTYKDTKKGINIFKTARGEFLVKNTISYNKSEILYRSFDRKLAKDFFNSFSRKIKTL